MHHKKKAYPLLSSRQPHSMDFGLDKIAPRAGLALQGAPPLGGLAPEEEKGDMMR